MRRVYLAGELVIEAGDKSVSMPFGLIGWRGNPTLVMLTRELKVECVNIMLARDPEGDKDLLFVGGDHSTERFRPMKRKK